ncbi:MAG: GNAT family N-acetyltransferase [Armatimonadota bacterium]
MKVSEYTDAKQFRDVVLPFLLEREAENNLIIGILLRVADGMRWSDDPPVLCTVEDGGRLVAVLMQTPPHRLLFTATSPKAISEIVRYFSAVGRQFPGATGPAATVELFTQQWAAVTGRQSVINKNLRLYQLDEVTVPYQVPGHAAFATEDDVSVIMDWHYAFAAEIRGDHVIEQALRNLIARQWVMLWKDPHPVSQVLCGSPTPSGIRISGVYTPPEYRGNGYASANVAVLSRHLLESGRKFCYLFTDLANPTSNHIYKLIGYRPVCDFTEYQFTE